MRVTQQVCPDVPRLCVDSEDALEAGAEGRHGRPVAVEKEVVVLQPVGQHVVRYDPPPALPHLPEESVTPPPGAVASLDSTAQHLHLTRMNNYWSHSSGDGYLVDKLLHLLHGVVSLQQRRHSHETFVAAPVLLFLLLLFPIIFFVYASVFWDVLTKQTWLRTRGPIRSDQSGFWRDTPSAMDDGGRRLGQFKSVSKWGLFFLTKKGMNFAKRVKNSTFLLETLASEESGQVRKLNISRAARWWQPA